MLVKALIAIAFLAIGILVGYIVRKNTAEKVIGSAETQAKNMILDAENRSEAIRKETLADARAEAHSIKQDAERDIRERREEVKKTERRLVQKEESLDRKIENIEQKEESISKKQRALAEKEKELDGFIERQIAELERISGCTAEEAKAQLLESIEKDVRRDASIMIKDIETKAKEEADRKAKEIITGAIQRCAADHVAETTVSVVPLPNDEMKGRIIGREGRNIRAIESATGADLIIDDTPEAIAISCFDPVRREIARITLEKLIQDGRIHPARIEDCLEKAKKEVETKIRREGERVVLEVGVHGLHPDLIKILGRLYYRTSYGQNCLNHSQEVALLSGLIATELGLDSTQAKRAGLLHDIGKALDHEYEGTHIQLGVEIAKRYKESPEIIHAIEAHHNDVEPQTPLAYVIMAADAISASRPGARSENLENYIKRLEKLEEIANTYDGVDSSYAIQAGREIRIFVKPEQVGDDKLTVVAHDIVQRIEDELSYPGQVKVNVIRESRAVDYAK